MFMLKKFMCFSSPLSSDIRLFSELRVLRVLSATLILSKNSCILDAKSRLSSAKIS